MDCSITCNGTSNQWSKVSLFKSNLKQALAGAAVGIGHVFIRYTGILIGRQQVKVRGGRYIVYNVMIRYSAPKSIGYSYCLAVSGRLAI